MSCALLTSNGLSTDDVMDAASDLVGPRARVVFVPTAATPIENSGEWQAESLGQLRRLASSIDTVDPANAAARTWLGLLGRADVVAVGGGDVGHLLAQLHESGAIDEIRAALLETVYLGISAGSIASGPDIGWLYVQYGRGIHDETTALGVVPFDVLPHAGAERLCHDALVASSGVVFELEDGSGVLAQDSNVTTIGRVVRRALAGE